MPPILTVAERLKEIGSGRTSPPEKIGPSYVVEKYRECVRIGERPSCTDKNATGGINGELVRSSEVRQEQKTYERPKEKTVPKDNVPDASSTKMADYVDKKLNNHLEFMDKMFDRAKGVATAVRILGIALTILGITSIFVSPLVGVVALSISLVSFVIGTAKHAAIISEESGKPTTSILDEAVFSEIEEDYVQPAERIKELTKDLLQADPYMTPLETNIIQPP